MHRVTKLGLGVLPFVAIMAAVLLSSPALAHAAIPHVSNCAPGSTDPMCMTGGGNTGGSPGGSTGGSNSNCLVSVNGTCLISGSASQPQSNSNQNCAYIFTAPCSGSAQPASPSSSCPTNYVAGVCASNGTPGGLTNATGNCPAGTPLTQIGNCLGSQSCPPPANYVALPAQCAPQQNNTTTGSSPQTAAPTQNPGTPCPGSPGVFYTTDSSACPHDTCTADGASAPPGQCKSCPVGSLTWYNDSSKCTDTCTADQAVVQAHTCEACPGSSLTWGSDQTQCPHDTCTLGTILYPPAKCQTCDFGGTAATCDKCDVGGTAVLCQHCDGNTTIAGVCKRCTDNSNAAVCLKCTYGDSAYGCKPCPNSDIPATYSDPPGTGNCPPPTIAGGLPAAPPDVQRQLNTLANGGLSGDVAAALARAVAAGDNAPDSDSALVDARQANETIQKVLAAMPPGSAVQAIKARVTGAIDDAIDRAGETQDWAPVAQAVRNAAQQIAAAAALDTLGQNYPMPAP